MADTMRDLFPAEVRFVGGENPSDRKLTNWALMEKDALALLAQAIGNIWNVDKTLQDRAEDPHPLLFTNLTRAIGNLELLNPAFLYGYSITQYAQPLTAGHTEHQLDYWVDLPDNHNAQDLLNAVYGSGANGEELDGSIVLDLDHVKLTPEELSAPGDWTVLGRTLYTYSGATGKYFVYNAVWKLHDLAASFSVIPNLVQVLNGSGMEVTKVAGADETYYILSTPTYLYDYNGNPPHPSFVGKQIPLPKVCRYGANQLIPEGLVTLWDLGNPPSYVNAQKVEGAVFYGFGDEYHLVVKNVNLEEDNQRYVLVCAAEGLAYAVRRLRDHVVAIINGTQDIHDQHSRLRGLRFTGTDVQGNPISGWFPFPRSRVFGHDHTMYLHRMGFDPEDENIWYNAMLGDLLLAAGEKVEGSWLNLYKDSRKVVFGRPDGSSIYYRADKDALSVDGVLVQPHDHTGGDMGVVLPSAFKVKVDGGDNQGDYLYQKIVGSGAVTVNKATDSQGKQVLVIGAPTASGEVAISGEDALPGFLIDKLRAGTGIELTVETNADGVQFLRISSTGSGGVLQLQEFTENGTFTVPDNVHKLVVYLFGAGGGGGGGTTEDFDFGGLRGGGGGGCGEVKRVEVDVTPGQQFQVTIGQGGAGGLGGKYAYRMEPIHIPSGNINTSDWAQNGQNGTPTSFGEVATVMGGRGGGAPFRAYSNSTPEEEWNALPADTIERTWPSSTGTSTIYIKTGPGIGGKGWNPSGPWGPGNGGNGWKGGSFSYELVGYTQVANPETQVATPIYNIVLPIGPPFPGFGGSQGLDPIGRTYLYGASGGNGGRFTFTGGSMYSILPSTGGGGAGSYWSRGGNGGYYEVDSDTGNPLAFRNAQDAPGPGAGGGGGGGAWSKWGKAYAKGGNGGKGGNGKVVVTWYA